MKIKISVITYLFILFCLFMMPKLHGITITQKAQENKQIHYAQGRQLKALKQNAKIEDIKNKIKKINAIKKALTKQKLHVQKIQTEVAKSLPLRIVIM